MLKPRRWLRIAVALAVLAILPVARTPAAEDCRLRLATTTSTDNSGLLAYLLPDFEESVGCKVDVIAVGTGKALRLGMNDDVDVVLVHDRAKENAFVADGHGLYRRDVMANDFVVVGAKGDPAGIRGTAKLTEAMDRLTRGEVPFISRGDESGTHAKERVLWSAAGIEPAGDWYRETGQGMGATLQIADQTGGYTLSDRATYLAMRDKLDLVIAWEGDPALTNPYGVLPVANEATGEHTQELAERFVGWLLDPETQARIGGFTKHGEVLFHPHIATVSDQPDS